VAAPQDEGSRFLLACVCTASTSASTAAKRTARFALSVIVATVSGTAGALLFLEGRVEKQAQLIVPAKIFEAIKGETG
jgi:hypothetical protein